MKTLRRYQRGSSKKVFPELNWRRVSRAFYTGQILRGVLGG